MSIEREYRVLLNSYLASVARGDGQAAAGHYTEDAILLLPNERPLCGRPQIEEHYLATVGNGIQQIVEFTEIQDFGDIVCITGTTISGETTGKWLEVLRRVGDGNLKIFRLCFNET